MVKESKDRMVKCQPSHSNHPKVVITSSLNTNKGRYMKKGPLKPWMIYDDNSADKQCEAYTAWLNFILKPQEDDVQNPVDCADDLIGSPTLKDLLIERRRVQSSQKALNFYNGPEMKSIRVALEQEICSNRLSMR